MSADDSKPSTKTSSVYQAVQLDVVELLKIVLQWTPLYRNGLNRALLQAAKVGSHGCVKTTAAAAVATSYVSPVLVTAGADVDSEDDNGDTAFVHAFRGGHTDVMELLCSSGCTTELVKMSLALATNNVNMIHLCHRLDIPIDNEDWNVADKDEALLLLNELKLDPFEGQYGRHGFEDSPFMYLVQEGRTDIVALLVNQHPCMNKYTPTEQQVMMNKALHKAVKHRRLDMIRLLLTTLGAELQAVDAQGRSVFVSACAHDAATAQYLLDAGADWQAADSAGLTGLHWAACVGFTPLCHRLIAHKGLPIDTPAHLGATPLMVAASSRHTDIVRLLLDYGCDVNRATPEGWTALHVAVQACAHTVVKLLLQHGAEVDVQSRRLTHNHDDVAGSSPLLIAIALNSITMLRHLFDAHCDIDLAGVVSASSNFSSSESDEDSHYEKYNCTPIQYAFVTRAWDIAAILIKARCSVTSIQQWVVCGNAPVHIPDDKLKYMRKLLQTTHNSPPKLRHLLRLRIRRMFGRQLLTKVDKLSIPTTTKNFLLCRELFHPTTGSCEV